MARLVSVSGMYMFICSFVLLLYCGSWLNDNFVYVVLRGHIRFFLDLAGILDFVFSDGWKFELFFFRICGSWDLFFFRIAGSWNLFFSDRWMLELGFFLLLLHISEPAGTRCIWYCVLCL